MVDKNDSLLREVDEELRREQMEKLWKKYGNYALVVAALIVLGVGGYKFMESRKIAAAESSGGRFQSAIETLREGKSADAATAFSEIAKSGPQGYAALAKLQLAGSHLKAGKPADALAAYEDLAKSGADPILTGFARLQAATVRAGEADFTEMKNRLNDLVADASPWRTSARELLGVAAMKAGKYDEARKQFEQIMGDRRAPPGVVDRVQTMMGTLIAAELAKASPPTAPSAGAPAAPAGTAAEPTKK